MPNPGAVASAGSTLKTAIVGAIVIAAFAASPGHAISTRAEGARAPQRAVVHHPDGARTGSRAVDVSSNYIGHDASEPTIGIDGEGNAFVAAAETVSFAGFIPTVDVMRSTDGGVKWKVVSPQVAGAKTHASTGDPYIFVDTFPGGSRVFTVDLQFYVCSLLSFSDNAGDSWITNPFGCGRPVNDHQTLFSAPPVTSTTVGYPHVLYYCYQEIVSSSCTKSVDGGITFTPTGETSFSAMDDDGNDCGGLHGHGFGGSDGSIYIPKIQCGSPMLAISRDEGATWTRHVVSKMPGAGHEASVAADDAGNINYGYIGRNLHPYLVSSRDGGKSWTKPMMIGSPGVAESSLPSLDVAADGEVVFAYMGSENPDADHSLNQTWNGYLTRIPKPFDRKPTLTSVQVNRDQDPLMRGECEQTKCGPEYDFIDVVFDGKGDVWSVFVDGCVRICATSTLSNDASEGLVTRWRQ